MAPKQAAPPGGAPESGPSKAERDRMREQAKKLDIHNLVEKRGGLELNSYDTGANYQMLHIFHRR